MKSAKNILIFVAVTLLFAPMISPQDLSKYRSFSLGSNLPDVSKQINQLAGSTEMIPRSPASIQQIEWWPVALNFLTAPESVQKILFSFNNLKLYKIAATYSSEATAGLTPADMIRAISARYGTATKVTPETGSRSEPAYGIGKPPVAQWEDAQYSVTLSHDSALDTFSIVILSKELNAEAEASIMAAAKQEEAEAPRNEIARLKKAADDLETERQTNLKAFRQ